MQVFRKTDVLPLSKKFAFFFSYYRAGQTSGNKLLVCTRSSGTHCASYKIICVTPKRLLKTHSFGIKANLPVNKILWPFFIVLLIMTNDREQFKRVQNFFDKYCASY